MKLDEMQKLCDGLPKPPWHYAHGDLLDHWTIDNDEESIIQDDSGVEPTTEFLQFVCASREFVPWAIERIQKLEEELLQNDIEMSGDNT
jgi:hypothetical protein